MSLRNKLLGGILLAVIGVIVFSPFIYQSVRFWSHMDEIGNLIRNTEVSERNMPLSVRKQLLFLLDGEVAPYAARLLLKELKSDSSNGSNISWQISYLSWNTLLKWIYSEEEQLEIISVLAPTGNGRVGLSKSSKEIFGKPLNTLNPEQVAILMVLARSPTLSQDSEKVVSEANKFLTLYKSRNEP